MPFTKDARSVFFRLAALIFTALLIFPAQSFAEQAAPPLYEAYARVVFQLRDAPDTDARRIHKVENRREVDVLEYAEDWCRVVADEEYVGYARTEWLWRFRSYDPALAPNLPLYAIVGTATARSAMTAAVEGYSGNAFAEGDRFAVTEIKENAVLFPMMRGTAIALPGSVTVAPLMPHDAAQPGDMIAAFTTFYNDETGGGLAEGRAFNIALGCGRIDGTIIESGETFSFNAYCGPYTRGGGYKMAPNISSDGEGYGGGVCQVSTTLYNALLSLPLRVTRWSIHRDSGVPYIPVGYDSAVGSYTDLAFINTLPYPVRIEAAPQNGVLSVFLYRAVISAP